ncbi:hypothetical protein [Actinomadura fibrosa]|uniref:Uncharacterized protein n=1 Tax=Actinomadura fibrosa TaxID=111802 RepID=A0ABW2X9Y2_9ACTN|nr:hypothetical protein [Actinomadura fibrosa]
MSILHLLHTAVADAMPIAAAFLTAWLTRDRRASSHEGSATPDDAAQEVDD